METRKDSADLLPSELLVIILSFLHIKSLIIFSKISKQWNHISKELMSTLKTYHDIYPKSSKNTQIKILKYLQTRDEKEEPLNLRWKRLALETINKPSDLFGLLEPEQLFNHINKGQWQKAFDLIQSKAFSDINLFVRDHLNRMIFTLPTFIQNIDFQTKLFNYLKDKKDFLKENELTEIQLAILCRQEATVRAILSEQSNLTSYNPTSISIYQSKHYFILKSLLHLAVYVNHLGVLDALLKANFYPNLVLRNETPHFCRMSSIEWEGTPLYLAVEMGHRRIAKRLLDDPRTNIMYAGGYDDRIKTILGKAICRMDIKLINLLFSFFKPTMINEDNPLIAIIDYCKKPSPRKYSNYRLTNTFFGAKIAYVEKDIEEILSTLLNVLQQKSLNIEENLVPHLLCSLYEEIGNGVDIHQKIKYAFAISNALLKHPSISFNLPLKIKYSKENKTLGELIITAAIKGYLSYNEGKEEKESILQLVLFLLNHPKISMKDMPKETHINIVCEAILDTPFSYNETEHLLFIKQIMTDYHLQITDIPPERLNRFQDVCPLLNKLSS